MQPEDEFIKVFNEYVKLMFIQVAKTLGIAGASAYQDWVHALNQSDGDLGLKVDALNRATTEGAREAVVQAYESSPLINKNNPYRWTGPKKLRRYANKQMLNALKDPDLVTASRSGGQISFNFYPIAELDRKAPQWYRLNFGAAPKKKEDRGYKDSITIGGQSVPFNLDSWKPSAAFVIPSSLAGAGGFFSAGPGKAENSGVFTASPRNSSARGEPFYIITKATKFTSPPSAGRYQRGGGGRVNKPKYLVRGIPAKGIRGAAFLDAGIDYFNTTYMTRLMEIMKQWFADAWNGPAAIPAPTTPGPKPIGGGGGVVLNTTWTGTRREWMAQTGGSRYEWDKYRAWQAGYARTWKGYQEYLRARRQYKPGQIGGVPTRYGR